MKIDEVMTLVKAGFSKEEILAMNGTTTLIEEKDPIKEINDNFREGDVNGNDSAEVLDETSSSGEGSNDKVVEKTTNVNFAPMMTDAQLERLAKMINFGNASIDVPNPVDYEKNLTTHFENILKGDY